MDFDFGVLPNHSPPTAKGRMFAMHQSETSPGQNGDEVHGADAVFVVGFGRKY